MKSSYIVSVGSNKELIVRARNADHANEKAELRLLRKGDRHSPVLPHLTRQISEVEAFKFQVSGISLTKSEVSTHGNSYPFRQSRPLGW